MIQKPLALSNPERTNFVNKQSDFIGLPGQGEIRKIVEIVKLWGLFEGVDFEDPQGGEIFGFLLGQGPGGWAGKGRTHGIRRIDLL